MNTSRTTGPRTRCPCPGTAIAGWTSSGTSVEGERPHRHGLHFPSPVCSARILPAPKGTISSPVREDGIVVFDLRAAGARTSQARVLRRHLVERGRAGLAEVRLSARHLLTIPPGKPAYRAVCTPAPRALWPSSIEEPEAFAKRDRDGGLAAYKPEIVAKPHVWYKKPASLHEDTSSPGRCSRRRRCADVVVTLTGARTRRRNW
jgi:hypothetical protein